MTNETTQAVFNAIVAQVAKERGISLDAANQYASLSFAFMTASDKVRFAEYHNLVVSNNVSKTGGEWTPEIAEAMRIPH